MTNSFGSRTAFARINRSAPASFGLPLLAISIPTEVPVKNLSPVLSLNFNSERFEVSGDTWSGNPTSKTYFLELYEDDEWVEVEDSSFPYFDPVWTYGTQYRVGVIATNAVGDSAKSYSSAITAIQQTVPIWSNNIRLDNYIDENVAYAEIGVGNASPGPQTAEQFQWRVFTGGVWQDIPGETAYSLDVTLRKGQLISTAYRVSNLKGWSAWIYSSGITVPNNSTVNYLPSVTSAPLFISSNQKLVEAASNVLAVAASPTATDTPASTQNITAGEDGSADTSAAVSAYGNIFQITEWKDQSGNGNHAVQATASLRPIIKNDKRLRGQVAINLSAPSNGVMASRYFNLPTGLATARTNLTVFVVFANGGGLSNGAAIMGLGTGSGSFDGFNMSVSNNGSWSTDRMGGVGITDSAFGGERGRQPSVGRLNVISAQISATSRRVVVADNVLNQTGQSITAAALTGGYIGRGPWSTAYFGCGDIAAVLIYPLLSDADVSTITDFLAERFDTVRATEFADQVIGVGDSIMAGTDSYQENFLYQMQESGVLARPCYMRDMGVGGQTAAQVYTNRTRLSSLHITSLTSNNYQIHAATNDIYNLVSGSIVGAETTIYANITNMVAYLKGLHASNRIIVDTCIPRLWPGTTTDRTQREAVRVAFNQLVRDGAATYGYVVNDLAAITEFGPTDSYGTPIGTHYYPDATHLLASGYALTRSRTVAAINAALTAIVPVNTAAPEFTGDPTKDDLLNGTIGTWNGATSFLYKWQSRTDGGNDAADISGETTSQLFPNGNYAGKNVRFGVAGVSILGTSDYVWSEWSVIETEGTFYEETPMSLGREANYEAAVDGGRTFMKSVGGGTISGVWDMSGILVNGQSYSASLLVRMVVNATGEVYNATTQRILLRTSNNVNLNVNETNGQIFTAYDSFISGMASIFGTFVYDSAKNYMGILGVSVPDGVRIEVLDVVVQEYVAPPLPWDAIANEQTRTLKLNDSIDLPVNGLLANPVLIPPNATEVRFKLTYTALIEGKITTSAYINFTFSTASAVGFAAADVTLPFYSMYWRPGDDADLWVTLPIVNPKGTTGNQFRLLINTAGLAGTYTEIIFRVDPAGVTPSLPGSMPVHRAPWLIDSSGAVIHAQADIANMQWSDSGFVGGGSSGTPCWRTRLSSGYAQPGNGENGLYASTEIFPAVAITPHSKGTDINGRPFVKLLSTRFPEPVVYEGVTYPFQAAVLTGHRFPEWRNQFGLWRAQLVTPSQRGAWSAFWSVGVRPVGDNTIWPPEIDFFEHFNGAYGGTYTQYGTSSAQHAGVHGSVTRSKVNGLATELDRLGFPADFSEWTQIHDYACLVTEEYVTHFVDGIEVFQHRNINLPSDGNNNWALYPLLNIAVKADPNDPFTSGTTEMLIYGVQHYNLGSGYTLTPYTETKPWPNRQILPVPNITHRMTADFVGEGVLKATIKNMAFSDNFDRANENLDANTSWTRVGGTSAKLTVAGNAINHSNLNLNTLYTSPDFSAADHFVQVRCKQTAVGCLGQVVCRVVDLTNWIGVRLFGTQLQLYKSLNGTLSSLGSSTVAVDDVIRIEASGNSITVKKNGTTVIGPVTVTDFATATKTGLIGIANVSASPWIDEYRSGPL